MVVSFLLAFWHKNWPFGAWLVGASHVISEIKSGEDKLPGYLVKAFTEVEVKSCSVLISISSEW